MLLSGIIKLHIIECPLENCSTKNNEKIYLPMTNEYSDRTKPYIYDTIFLHNLIIEIMNYFISQNFYNMEIIINFSIYYLRVIGNLSQSIYFYEKVKKMKGNLLEKFQLERLRILISKNLIEKLKKINEDCLEIDDLNMTYYYKYEYYKKLFFKEIMKDLDNIEEFWKYFSKIENKKIDYNKIFKTTEKIIQSKKNIEILWNKLFNMYGGINEIFDFYCEYVSQINDDSFLKRKLEEYKQKNENFSDNININYNHLMFKSDVGIVIINGDKGKEGIIEKFNDEFCVLFKYNRKELKGMNINLLMPTIFGKNHKKYMSRYIINGEKKFINTNQMTLYGKDK
jgi:PAS domain-containing protein